MSLTFDFPHLLESDLGPAVSLASRAVERVLEAAADADMEPLERRSPGLKGNDWSVYLRCSIVRMAHVLAALSRRGVTRGRVLDVGSYFGNVSLMLASAGFRVDAVDSYAAYEHAFDGCRRVLQDAGVTIHDYCDVGYDLRKLPAHAFDAVICLGVVEHIPHTPRLLLEALDRVCADDGFLVLDTPNQAYLYARQRLASGESVMAPIATQYSSEIPFEGHHREFTPAEMLWMLSQISHHDAEIELFNYSIYALGTIAGRDLENFWTMALEPDMREIIMTISRREPAGAADERATDWRRHFVETESHWVRAVPDEFRERLRHVDLRSELSARRSHENLVREIESRDRTIADLHDHIGTLQRQHDARLDERLKRYWRRLWKGAQNS